MEKLSLKDYQTKPVKADTEAIEAFVDILKRMPVATLSFNGVSLGDRFMKSVGSKARILCVVTDFNKTVSMATGEVLKVTPIAGIVNFGARETFEVSFEEVIDNKTN